MPPQGLCSFPGVNQIMSASLDIVHGITPSVAQILMVPQPGFVGAGGNLVFTFNGQVVTLYDCRCDAAQFEVSERGQLWRLSIFDRRWKWSRERGGGKLSGQWNVRNSNGDLDESRKKNAQELAGMILEAMNESGFNVGDLPNDDYPPVDWDGAWPAGELANLADRYGARVVLEYLSNTVAIRIAGEGAELPEGVVLADSLTIDPPEVPDTLGILCGHTRFQGDWILEAVGLDTDGTVKQIAALSYAPTEGFSYNCIPFMKQVEAGEKRELALRTVFKWYRIKFPLTVPGFQGGQIESINQLAIESEQCDTVTIDGAEVNKPAEIAGIYYPEPLSSQSRTNNVTAENPDWTTDAIKYQKPFTVDTKLGIVKFSDLVFRNTETADPPTKVTTGQATLRLRTAVQVRDPNTWGWTRYEKTRDTGGTWNTGTRWAQHDELNLTSTPSYDTDYNVESTATNQGDTVDPQCETLLDALEREYQMKLPQSISYPGLMLVELDGAIQHITFSVGENGCTTVISRNTERRDCVDTYKEMRFRERGKEVHRRAGHLPPVNPEHAELNHLLPKFFQQH